MSKIRKMRDDDVEVVARMVALDHDEDPDKGYKVARKHTADHLEIVPEHCFVVEDDRKQIIAAMIIHPQDQVLEIEDFHVKEIQRNKDALTSLKKRLLEYLEDIQTEVLCCPYALKRLVATY